MPGEAERGQILKKEKKIFVSDIFYFLAIYLLILSTRNNT
jgi:hypothetical protein